MASIKKSSSCKRSWRDASANYSISVTAQATHGVFGDTGFLLLRKKKHLNCKLWKSVLSDCRDMKSHGGLVFPFNTGPADIWIHYKMFKNFLTSFRSESTWTHNTKYHKFVSLILRVTKWICFSLHRYNIC